MKALRSLAPSVLAILAACTSTAHGPEVAAPAPSTAYVPPRNDDALVLYSAGADAWFADPKDERLRAALALVEKRVAELPGELDEPDVPADAIVLAIEMLSLPMVLRADVVEEPQPGSSPFRAQWTFESDDPERATDLARRFADLLQKQGLPTLGKSEATHGMQVLPIGPFSAFHGVLGPERSRTFAIAVGQPELDELALGSLDLPASVRPFLAWKLDYGTYAKAIQMMQGEGAENPLAMFGVDGTVVVGGIGYGTDRMYGSMRTQDYVSAARQAGMLASGPLAAREIAMVPADATCAALGRLDPRGIVKLGRTAFAAQAEENGMPPDTDPIALLTAFTGFDIERQLFDHLGETWGMYLSDTTGGGGLYSAVAFLAVQDEAAIVETLTWAEKELNAALETHAEGYVRLVRKDLGEHTPAWTLTAPGLPVPLELSLALDSGYLFAAMTPQGAQAAIAQARSGRGGLAENARFRALAPGELDDLYSISFADTPRLGREGYPFLGLGCAALANAVRSKHDPARDPGAILPAFGALFDDVKASVALGRIQGNDLVVTWQADRSLLANASAMLGLYGNVIAIGAVAAAVVPKLMESQSGGSSIISGDEEVPEDMEDMEEGMEEDEEMPAEPPPDEDEPTPH